MSVYVSLYVAPADERALSHERFIEMVLGAWQRGEVGPPATIISGPLFAPKTPMPDIASAIFDVYLPPELRVTEPQRLPIERSWLRDGQEEAEEDTSVATLWYRGDDPDAFTKALRRVPFEEDVRVTFKLDYGATMRVSFFALATPRRLYSVNMSGAVNYLTASHFADLGHIKGHQFDLSDLRVGETIVTYYGDDFQRIYEYA